MKENEETIMKRYKVTLTEDEWEAYPLLGSMKMSNFPLTLPLDVSTPAGPTPPTVPRCLTQLLPQPLQPRIQSLVW